MRLFRCVLTLALDIGGGSTKFILDRTRSLSQGHSGSGLQSYISSSDRTIPFRALPVSSLSRATRLSFTARVQRGSPSLSLHHFRGVAKAALDCAHRTSTVSSCAFCEQEGHLAAPLLILLRPYVARAGRLGLPTFPSSTLSLQGGVASPNCGRRTSFFPPRFLPPRPMREEPGRLSLRASSDHRFIVGALRARRTAGCSLIPLLIVRVPGAQGLALPPCSPIFRVTRL